MKAYMLIEGSNKAIDAFEAKVAEALDLGYSLAGDLISHSVSPGDVRFYQAVILGEDEDELDEDFDEEDMEEEINA